MLYSEPKNHKKKYNFWKSRWFFFQQRIKFNSKRRTFLEFFTYACIYLHYFLFSDHCMQVDWHSILQKMITQVHHDIEQIVLRTTEFRNEKKNLDSYFCRPELNFFLSLANSALLYYAFVEFTNCRHPISVVVFY